MTQGALFSGVGHDPGCKRIIRRQPGIEATANFGGPNDCYRYNLIERWGHGPLALWCMMNPSGAGAEGTDMTVAKTGRISRRLLMGGQMIANACAYRATDRMRLLEVADPVGPGNSAAILAMADKAGLIVVAHGRLPGALQQHADAMVAMLRLAGHRLWVLRLTPDNIPFHPLARGKGHVPEDIIPSIWE